MPTNPESNIVSGYRPDAAHPHQASTYERSHNAVRPARIPLERMEFDLDGTVRHLTSSQRIRLTQDLAVVETNVNVLNDMLAELRPDIVSHDDLNLLQELYQTCRAMHRRVVEFLSQVSDEEVTPSLLQVNDNLNNAFSRYERFERYRIRALRSEMISEAAALDLASYRFGSIHGAHPAGALRLASGPHQSQPPMLAITSGPSAIMNTRRTGVTSLHPIVRADLNLTNGQLTNGNPQRNHSVNGHDVNADDDDDDSLIDIGASPSQSHACHSTSSEDTDRWLGNRQLVPVPQLSSIPNHDNLLSSGPRLTLEEVTDAVNTLAIVPTTQTLQIRPSASQMQCAVRTPTIFGINEPHKYRRPQPNGFWSQSPTHRPLTNLQNSCKRMIFTCPSVDRIKVMF
ncbi:TOM1 protein 2 [Fasciola gigantica]|uniref:TOM1 protein 2 n=1 Tax=Fasciola gigantica TaxID=46835 RepID=A0A504WV16_FASGI|nr:TOM1 protein 2 [Fasciola gigantica]